ncbi:MAG: HAD family hydrolase [Eubacterium sp.]|nr:HAD family hydrolase [Eubacterium sp.]
MIQLIVCDVDGTLIEDGGSAESLNPEYYEVIRKLGKKGIQFAVCSGRQKVSVEKLFAPVRDQIYLAVDGGSMVFYRGECIYSKTLPKELCRELIEDARQIPQCDIMVCGLKRAYASSADSEMYRWMVNGYGYDIQAVGDLTKNVPDEIVKISLYHHNMVEQLTDPWFRPRWENRVRLNLAGIQWLDCVPVSSGKGTALEFLQQSLSIGREETMAFGDNQNDMDMLRCAGKSFAVANAREELKKMATGICGSYREDGVLRELKKLL